jgi:hypothetical protein
VKTFALSMVLLAASLHQVACGKRLASSHRQEPRNGDAAQVASGMKAPGEAAHPQAESGEDHYNLANDLKHDLQADDSLREYGLALQAQKRPTSRKTSPTTKMDFSICCKFLASVSCA